MLGLRGSTHVSVAVLAATLCLALPAAAPAQSVGPLDLADALEPLRPAQETVGRAIEDTGRLISSLPPVGDGGGGGSAGQPSAPPQVDGGAPPPQPPGSFLGATGDGGDSSTAPPDEGSGREERRGEPGGRGEGAARAGEPAPAAAQRDEAEAPIPPPSSDPPVAEPRGVPAAIERIVSVVPWPIKATLGLLACFAAGTGASAWRTRRKLALAERRAATDSLTGLPNRISAEQALERLVAQSKRTGSAVSVVLFDLDRFKAINDGFGHATGDDVLRAVAHAARRALRGGDHVARFGGEEFILLLPDTDLEGAVTAAETMRVAIEELELEVGPGSVTASFGVAALAPGASPTELIAAADRALYEAKGAGRNRVEASEPVARALAPVAA